MIAASLAFNSDTIARLNDCARLGLDRTARIVFTHNCLATLVEANDWQVPVVQALVLKAFRTCTFAADSPERDFAAIEFQGSTLWLKIDCYDERFEYGSEDPADASKSRRHVTIMLPEDY